MVTMGVAVVFLNLSNNAVHLSLKLGEKEVETVYVCTHIMHHVYIQIRHISIHT